MKLKKTLLATAALFGMTVLTPAAFASTGVANITATVPQYCEITSVLDVHADFSTGGSGRGTSGVIAITCNENQDFTLTTSSTDENGILYLAHDNGGEPMPVEIKNRNGILWTNTYQHEDVGIGQPQTVSFYTEFNANRGLIPKSGAYAAQAEFTLTAF